MFVGLCPYVNQYLPNEASKGSPSAMMPKVDGLILTIVKTIVKITVKTRVLDYDLSRLSKLQLEL